MVTAAAAAAVAALAHPSQCGSAPMNLQAMMADHINLTKAADSESS